MTDCLAAWLENRDPDADRSCRLERARVAGGCSAQSGCAVVRGTYAMGQDPQAGAVVDAFGRVHGIDGLMVADASIMPNVAVANTSIPTAAMAHRLAHTST